MNGRDTKRRLLFLITSSDGGGAQKHLYELTKLLDKEKYIIEGACAPGGPLIERLNGLGIKVFSIPTLRNAINPVRDFLAFTKIYRLIKVRRYDIVHCHSTKAGILGRIAARLARVPAILFTVHGFAFREAMFLPKKLLLILMERLAAACCHRIITVSEHDRNDALKLRLKKSSDIVTIHNGIDVGSFKNFVCEDGDQIRRKLGIDRNCNIVGTIANFYGNKGYPYLLRAAKLVMEEEAGIRFISIGDGPLRREMERMAQSLGLNGKFIFTGYQSKPFLFLSIMDIFVLSSIKEGLPFTLLEAMAMGKPVVATSVGGIPEVVEDQKTGLLVKPGDPYSLAEAILILIKDIDLREKIAKNGREIIVNFSLHGMVEKIDNLYGTLLNPAVPSKLAE
jgi:glycosyltransferase involved in cell wall biosynthesis